MPNQFPRETSNKYLASYCKRLQHPAEVPYNVPISTILVSACIANIKSVKSKKTCWKTHQNKSSVKLIFYISLGEKKIFTGKVTKINR